MNPRISTPGEVRVHIIHPGKVSPLRMEHLLRMECILEALGEMEHLLRMEYILEALGEEGFHNQNTPEGDMSIDHREAFPCLGTQP